MGTVEDPSRALALVPTATPAVHALQLRQLQDQLDSLAQADIESQLRISLKAEHKEELREAERTYDRRLREAEDIHARELRAKERSAKTDLELVIAQHKLKEKKVADAMMAAERERDESFRARERDLEARLMGERKVHEVSLAEADAEAERRVREADADWQRKYDTREHEHDRELLVQKDELVVRYKDELDGIRSAYESKLHAVLHADQDRRLMTRQLEEQFGLVWDSTAASFNFKAAVADKAQKRILRERALLDKQAGISKSAEQEIDGLLADGNVAMIKHKYLSAVRSTTIEDPATHAHLMDQVDELRERCAHLQAKLSRAQSEAQAQERDHVQKELLLKDEMAREIADIESGYVRKLQDLSGHRATDKPSNELTLIESVDEMWFPHVGIGVHQAPATVARAKSLKVVELDAAAKAAGLQEGDTVVKVDTQVSDVHSMKEFWSAVSKICPGAAVNLTVMRGKGERRVKLSVKDRQGWGNTSKRTEPTQEAP